jgi:hypothetical protein
MERYTHRTITRAHTGSIYNNNNHVFVHVFSISEEPGFSDPRRLNVYYYIHVLRAPEIQWSPIPMTVRWFTGFRLRFSAAAADVTIQRDRIRARCYTFLWRACNRHSSSPRTRNARIYDNNCNYNNFKLQSNASKLHRVLRFMYFRIAAQRWKHACEKHQFC